MTSGLDFAARYGRMRWNTPLSEQHAALLLQRLQLEGADLIADLGAGWAELLLRGLAAAGPTTRAAAVDTDASAIERGRAAARQRGLADRVDFVVAEADAWHGDADRVLCIGSAHALGGTERALTILRAKVRPGGRLLYGDACWEGDPTPAAAELFDEVLPLDELIRHAVAAGWRVVHLSTADQREWDDFESTWRAGRHEWVLAHPDHADALAVRDDLDAQLSDYVSIYRGVLGFCYLVLAAPSNDRSNGDAP